METKENRQVARDSLFLLADLRIEGVDGEHRIKVRNLSSGGMMGEARVGVVSGTKVSVNFPSLGWVLGTVAWVQETRFGVAFADAIDHTLAREPVTTGE